MSYSNFKSEFKTVDILLESNADTRAVDCFCISLLKAERQMRKIFTYLIFQSPAFKKADIPAIKKSIFENNQLYFEHFIKGFNLIYDKKLSDIFGEEYEIYRNRFQKFKDYRNKIFHGQLTDQYLTRT